MNDRKLEFFSAVREFFLQRKTLGEREWGDVISKYGGEPYFGRMLRQAGHVPTVESGGVHHELRLPLYWNYEVSGGFYFNALGSDLKNGQFEELKDQLTRLLGEPDEIFTHFGLNEPRWEEEGTSLSLYHVDSHGGGYERIGLMVPIRFIKAGT